MNSQPQESAAVAGLVAMTDVEDDNSSPADDVDSGGKEEKKIVIVPDDHATRAMIQEDYEERLRDMKQTRTDQERKATREVLESVFKPAATQEAAFTSMDTKTAAEVVNHLKAVVKDPGSAAPNAGVIALCCGLISPKVDDKTRGEIYHLLINTIAGLVRHQPTLFQSGILRQLFCFVLRKRHWDKWTNACLHSINTFLADDKSPLAFALTYGSLLEVMCLLNLAKDSTDIKNKSVKTELETQLEFTVSILEPLVTKLLDPEYRPDGRFESGAICVKYQNAVGWFPVDPSSLESKIMQQVKDDIAEEQQLVLKDRTRSPAPTRTHRKRGRTKEFDDAVLAGILQQSFKRRRQD